MAAMAYFEKRWQGKIVLQPESDRDCRFCQEGKGKRRELPKPWQGQIRLRLCRTIACCRCCISIAVENLSR